jgi:hypothetical protein
MANAAKSECAATVRFSWRIAPDPKTAGLLDMLALSLWSGVPAKPGTPR